MTLIVAITGVSGSGKTTLAEGLVDSLNTTGPEPVATLVSEDDYYLDSRSLPGFDAATYNFDDPAAKDHALLAAHLDALARGEGCDRPVYSMNAHGRTAATVRIEPVPVVVLEGTHLLCPGPVAERCAVKVFVETPLDVAIARRFERDIRDRGRDAPGVLSQYLRTVRPSLLQWILPSRARADLVVPGFSPDGDGIGRALAMLERVVRERAGLSS